MKHFLAFIFICFICAGKLSAQAPTNNADFTYLGKNYSAKYDAGKKVLNFNEELSYEIYDQSGTIVKRGFGKTADFKSLLKNGEELTFTVILYKSYKKTKKKKKSAIKQQGQIGTMLVTDSE
ncbi:MAG TPA: hypothetical protein VL651_04600 [Bacteroidia bacterium]|jgi:hypothetical protein|nr:hypothetical protein [Bacteroidia bacterium]